MRSRPAAAVTLLLLLATAAAAQQIVIGGEMSAGVSLRGNLPGGDFTGAFSGGLGSTLLFSPVVSVFGPDAELRSRLTFRQAGGSAGDPAVTLDELRLSLYPSDRISVEVGRLSPRSGGALLLSPVNYLARLPLDAIAAPGGGTGASALPVIPVDAVAVRTFFGSSYARLAVVPVPRPLDLPALPEGALDRLPFLSTVADDLISGSPLTRRDVAVAPATTLSDWQRASFVVEIGVGAGPADLAFFAYHGLDPVPAVRGTVVTGTAGLQPGEFDLEVSVSEATVTALGAAVQSVFGPFMVWADGSFALSRTLGSVTVDPTEVSAGVRLTELVKAPALDVVAGVAVDLARPALTLAAELRHGFYFSPREDALRLDLPGLLFAAADLRLADGIVRTSFAAAVFLADGSFALLPSIRVAPASELELSLAGSFLAGPQGSLLSSVSPLSTVRLDLAYRF